MLARLRAWQMTAGQMRLLKVAAFLACTEPGVSMVYNAFWGDLGINPVETLQHVSGEGALTMLICSLAVTPVRRITGQNRLQGLRRMLGLWAFFYGVVHFLFYLLLDQSCLYWSECHLAAMVDDVMKRKFILAGMVSFLAMVPLALTSTKGWIRRLGKKWTALHKLAYVAGIAGALHYIWKAKVFDEEAWLYAGWVALFLLLRVWFAWRKRALATPKLRA